MEGGSLLQNRRFFPSLKLAVLSHFRNRRLSHFRNRRFCPVSKIRCFIMPPKNSRDCQKKLGKHGAYPTKILTFSNKIVIHCSKFPTLWPNCDLSPKKRKISKFLVLWDTLYFKIASFCKVDLTYGSYCEQGFYSNGVKKFIVRINIF